MKQPIIIQDKYYIAITEEYKDEACTIFNQSFTFNRDGQEILDMGGWDKTYRLAGNYYKNQYIAGPFLDEGCTILYKEN